MVLQSTILMALAHRLTAYFTINGFLKFTINFTVKTICSTIRSLFNLNTDWATTLCQNHCPLLTQTVCRVE